jgi:hypothetical protein
VWSGRDSTSETGDASAYGVALWRVLAKLGASAHRSKILVHRKWAIGASGAAVWRGQGAGVGARPTADEQGMVFTTAHDHLTAAWVNTLFDENNERFQYVYMVPAALVTVIRIQLEPQGENTKVDVEYERTALNPETDAHVRRMAGGDRKSGPEWEEQVNEYLRKVGKR